MKKIIQITVINEINKGINNITIVKTINSNNIVARIGINKSNKGIILFSNFL